MEINYHNKKFRAIQNSDNGEITEEVVFHYKQEGTILSCSYSGGEIMQGHLLGKVDKEGSIDLVYHQLNKQGEIRTGKCFSHPEITEEGKIVLHEQWQWTSGDGSKGTSLLKEI